MTPNPFDVLRQAIQNVLDSAGDGYQLAHYVVVMGIQKIDADGAVTSSAWLAHPIDQADYVTDGLLNSADEMRAWAGVEDE